MDKVRSRGVVFGTTALIATLAGLAPAGAQSTDRLEAIERQIQSLQQELRAMKRDMAAKDGQVRSAQREAAQARAAATQAQTEVRTRPVPAAPAVVTAVPAQAPLFATGAAAVPPANIPGAASGSSPTGGPAGLPEETKGTFHVAGVTVTLGGFFAAESAFRSRNLSADLATNFNAIPFAQSPLAHESEFRESARQSRLSLLAFGDPLPNVRVTGYVESDFLDAAPTANSNESDSYTPRLRQAFASIDYDDRDDDVGLHLLAGQAWSLLTLNRVGIVPRTEDLPLTIDPQYSVGFTWARQTQLRASADFLDHRLWLAASLENPQTTFSTGGYGTASTYFSGANGLVLPIGGFANVNNAGGSLNAPTVNYSDDIAPDLIVKAAYDPGFGHYETYGLMRLMHDRVDNVGTGHNNTQVAGGGGAAAILPVVRGVLDVQGSFLGGYGIGRYASGQLPDATLKPNGDIAPLPEIAALVGVVGHPVKSVDLYGYLGTEHVGKAAFLSGGKGYGYGSPLFVNSGCNTELSTLTCTGNTSGLEEATLGFWWRPYQGNFGTVQTGAQYSYVRRTTFKGVGGAPSADENIVLLSFRYYPFQ